MLPANINKSSLPHRPGVYIFKDSSKNIIYVGKAIDLYHRVSSYFSKQNSTKTRVLSAQIDLVETIIVESEIEALILEANLIKKYLPAFNVRLTDDKDYLYIKVTNSEFPKIVTARKQDLKDALRSFGPFPSSTTVKATLQRLRRIFPWCSNPPRKVTSDKVHVTSMPCFYYHLGLCPGPCAGIMDKKEYRKVINHFIKFMEGKKQELEDELISDMSKSAASLDFEKAQVTKRIISGIEYITSPNRVNNYLDNPNFLESESKKGLLELRDLFKLQEIPERIEAYDISNISGKDATGSMVVLTHGEIDKNQYRRFKIKIAGKPNDYAMHSEMMRRRLKHKEWPLPAVFIIDGGRGQVRAAKKELVLANVELPIYGLAKRLELVYPVDGDIIKLARSSAGLKLLQKVRDEAHRFAITYHRKLRKKSSGFS